MLVMVLVVLVLMLGEVMDVLMNLIVMELVLLVLL